MYANGAFVVANSAYNQANIAIINAINAGSYANSAFLKANSAYDSQNVTGSYSNSAYAQANSASLYANGAFVQANAAYNSQNTTGSYANSAFTKANNALPLTGGSISGSLSVSSDLSVGGNLTVLGTATSINTSSFTVNDSLLILGLGNYTSDILDIGFASHYNAGVNAHTGLIRDSDTKEWVFFEGYTPEVSTNNNIVITDPSFKYANVYANTVKANVIANTIYVSGYNVFTYITNAYTQANSAYGSQNTTGSYTNTAFNYANSAYTQANTATNNAAGASLYANGAFVQANSAYGSQNTTGSYANTAFNYANSAYGQANTATLNSGSASLYANSAFLQANTAYVRANNSINANTGGTITGNLIVANTFVASYNPSYTNWLQATGSNTGNAVIFSSVGGDANVSMVLQPQGNGAIDLATSSKGVNISNGGTVTAITRTAIGSAYTGFPTVAITAPTTAGGVQATANAQLVAATGTVVSGGTGYTLNDTLTVTTSGGSSPITLTVTGVTGGVVTSVTANSSALTTIPSGTVSVSGGTGSGATFNIIYVVAATFTITNAGSGYVEQPTVSFSGGGGSGATAYATVGSTPVIRSLGQNLDFYTPSGNNLRIADANANAVNFVQIQGTSTNNGSRINFTGSDADVNAVLTTKGIGSYRFNTNNTIGTEQMRVSHTASAVNYVNVTGAATGGGPTITTAGSDANPNLVLTSKGLGYVRIYNNSSLTHDFRFNGTSNYLVSQSGATGSGPVFKSDGSDTNIDLNIITKGTGNTNIKTANGTQLVVADAGAGQNAVNYLQVQGSNTANAIIISSQGADANVSMAHIMKGNGSFDIQTSNGAVVLSNGGTVTAITGTATGSGYTTIPTITISPPTTAGGTQATGTVAMQVLVATIQSGGSGYAIGDTITFTGGTFSTPVTLTVATLSGSAIATFTSNNGGTYTVLPTNPISTTTSGAGTGATFNATSWGVRLTAYTITGAGSGYVEQPTITFSSGSATAYATVGGTSIVRGLGTNLDFYTPNNTTAPTFRIYDNQTAGTGQFISVRGSSTVPVLFSSAALTLSSTGVNNVSIFTNANSQEQFRVAHTASAVNYVQVTGAATGSNPVISVQGSDAARGLVIATKAGGNLFLASSGGTYTQFAVSGGNNAVNYLQVAGTTATNAPILSSQGTDTNIDLNIITKGTGNTKFQTANGTQLVVADAGAGQNSVNYLQVQGSNTANAIIISSQGADANVSMVHVTKGNGSFDIQTSGTGVVALSNGGTVTAITRTATGGSYTTPPTWSASIPTTAGGVQSTGTTTLGLAVLPTIAGGGTGYTVGDVLTFVGGTFTTAATLTVTTVSGGVITAVVTSLIGAYSIIPSNPISVTGGTGTGATFNASSWGVATLTISTAGSGYVEQPTVSFSGGGGSGATAFATIGGIPTIKTLNSAISFVTDIGELFRITNSNGTTASPAYLNLIGGGSTAINQYASGGAGAISLGLISKGSFPVNFCTGGTASNQQLQVSHTTSAVNYLQVTGAATGNIPNISSQGSDSNISLNIAAKGSSGVITLTANGAPSFAVGASTGGVPVGYLKTLSSPTGGSVYTGVISSDANMGANWFTRGNGSHYFATADGATTQFVVSHTASAVNYLQATGATTGNSPSLTAAGSDSAVQLVLSSKSTGSILNYTNNGNQLQFAVLHTASAVNYVQVTGAVTGGAAAISAQGSDANADFSIKAKGLYSTYIGNTNGYGLRVTAVASTANFLSADGKASGGSPTLSTFGSDTNIDLTLQSKGTGNTNIQTANGTQFRVADNGGGLNAVNYVQVQGSNTGNTLIVSAQGTDANVAMTFLPKGNGAFNISTANGVNLSSGNTSVTALTLTAAGSAYTSVPSITISPPTTAGGVQATARCVVFVWSNPFTTAGTGYTVGNTLTAVGGTGTAYSFTVTSIDGSGGVTGASIVNYGAYTVTPTNPVTFTGGSGSGFTSNMTWTVGSSITILSAGSGYVEQPTVTFSSSGGSGAAAYATVGSTTTIKTLGSTVNFNTPSGTGFTVFDGGVTPVAWWGALGTNNVADLRTQGGGVTAGALTTQSAVPLLFRTNYTEQFRVAHTASAVNYVQITGAVTGSAAQISAQGSDASIALQYNSKSTTGQHIFTANATNAFRILPVTSAQNYPTVSSAITGSGVIFSAAGTDTNIDINLTPKGTGRVVTTSTLVAGLISGGTF